MPRRPTTETVKWRPMSAILAALAISCLIAYMLVTTSFRRQAAGSDEVVAMKTTRSGGTDCCRGVEHLELWGNAVKWGSDHRVNSAADCCRACKAMCGDDGPCLCDSWVYCGDEEQCGDKFRECWLKKQDDALFPTLHDSGEQVIWTSGLIFGKGEGIIGMETEYGTLHIKLYPDCAPNSVAYIVEILRSRHCPGCQFYRAEDRGELWDTEGNHLPLASFGPPYGLIQGTLEADGVQFNKIAAEECPSIERGSVAWVGSGPEFFISLANHDELRNSYTVFGSVLPEDMEIAEKIAGLPTKPEIWNDITVGVLEKPVPLKIKRPQKTIVTST